MYKLSYFVPDSHLDTTKQAVFAAGAGRQGNYSHCCFQTKGIGQFMPLEGSQPFIGEQSQIERVEEWRVEMLCPKERLPDVLNALRQAHPYEEPAIDVVHLVDVSPKI